MDSGLVVNQPMLLWILGMVFAVSQAALIFIWNNLKAELKELRTLIESKADSKEMDNRRQDIKDLYELVGNAEKALLARVGKLETDLMVALAKVETKNAARNTRSR